MEYKNSTITIHQTLHGYSSGHNLLACSLSLSTNDERLMTLLSDMSGPSMTKGFETYITGYALLDRPVYVLARTWYAPEMNRPGCVWTHSLILDFNDLTVISQPQLLLEYFRRPKDSKENNHYSTPIIIEAYNSDSYNSNHGLEKFKELRELFRLVYENPQKQIFVPTNEVTKYENAIFAIWEYQWAKLRQKFTFCTGSIESRSFSNITFDIQVIPEKNREKIQRKNLDQIFLNSENYLKNYPSWVDYLIREISITKLSLPLKYCLNAWGTDIFDGRKSYSKLIMIYIESRRNNNPSYSDLVKITDLITQEFPSINEAVALKRSLLGERQNEIEHDMFEYREENLLRILCTIKKYDSLNPGWLRIKDRAIKLFHKKPNEAIKLAQDIVASKPNPLGEDFISGLSESIDAEKIQLIANESEALLEICLSNTPLLGIKPGILNTTDNVQRERFDIMMSSPRLVEYDALQIINFILENQYDNLAQIAFKRFEKTLVRSTLDWINKNITLSNFHINSEWKDQLRVRPEIVMEWLSNKKSRATIKIFAFIASLLDPKSKEVLSYGAKFWLECLDNDNNHLTRFEYTEYYVCLLSFALYSNEVDAGELFAETFPIVYDAARDNRLPYECWRRISGKLPELSWYDSWDKCERLRQGLAHQFTHKPWNAKDFFKSIENDEIFEEIVKYAYYDNITFRYYLRDIVKKLSFESIHTTNSQKKVLKRYSFL